MSLVFRNDDINGKPKESLKTNLYITKEKNEDKFKIVINGTDWDFTTKIDSIMIKANVKLTKETKLKPFKLLVEATKRRK